MYFFFNHFNIQLSEVFCYSKKYFFDSFISNNIEKFVKINLKKLDLANFSKIRTLTVGDLGPGEVPTQGCQIRRPLDL